MTALRAFFAIGIAFVWLLLVAPPIFESLPRVYTGISLAQTGAAVQPNIARIDPGSPAYRAGLRSGDVLRCLSLRDYTLLFEPTFGYDEAYRPGTPISTCAQRNGTSRMFTFEAQTGPPTQNMYGSNALGILRVCVLLVFLITGIALVLAKPSPMTWIFYVYCLTTAPSAAFQQIATVLPGWAFIITSGIVSFVTTITVAFLLIFSVLVPDEKLPKGWRRYALYGALAIALADFAVVGFDVLQTRWTVAPRALFTFDQILTGITVLVVIARLATMHRSERARFGWAAFAIIFGVITNNLREAAVFGAANEISTVAAQLTVVMPLCLMYGILKRHVIDVRFVISRTVVYAALTTLIVAVIGMVDWLTSAYLHQARVAMAIDAAVTIGLAFALHRAYGWIEAVVDFLLYRDKHNAETYLDRMAKTLLRAKNEQTVDLALVQAPHEKLDLTMAALFRLNESSFILSVSEGWNAGTVAAVDQEHELVRFLVTERTKLHINDLRKHVAEEFEGHGAAPAVAIPLFQGDALVAFAVYGIHRDGTKLDPDEIDTLERLCDIAAQAYTGIELARYRSQTSGVPALENLQYQ